MLVSVRNEKDARVCGMEVNIGCVLVDASMIQLEKHQTVGTRNWARRMVLIAESVLVGNRGATE